MKITFVYLGAENLAIEILSSVLKARGHRVSLAFDPGLFGDKQYLDIPSLEKLFSYRRRLIRDIENSGPDLIAFSVGTDIYAWACSVAGDIKKKLDVPIIFGGVHPTSVPEIAISNPNIDMVCVGEGEEALLELADRIERKDPGRDIPNLWVKAGGEIIKNPVRPPLQDLDSLPFPDKALFENNIRIRNGRYMIMTSRGCPFSCTYCYNNVLKEIYRGMGRFVRQRTEENVLQELREMKERYQYGSVDFMDDMFVMNKKWLKEFLPRYKAEIGVPFDCMTDTPSIDRETAFLLKEHGCNRVKFGVQTMSQQTRDRILNRAFEKDEKIRNALLVCDEAGIKYSLDHIMGIPYETEEDEKATARFYAGTRADRVCCYALFYYPKTEITQTALQGGFLKQEDVRAIENGECRTYVYGSSLGGKELARFRSFRKFYALMPLVPYPVSRFLLDTNLYRLFRFVPRAIMLGFELLASLKTRHLRGLDYLAYYWFHLKKRLHRWK